MHTATSSSVRGISSMATRLVLAELSDAWGQLTGIDAAFDSCGGVDAAKRVEAGEPFDVAVLAADAIDKLIAGGHVVSGSKSDLAHSPVSVAVRAGAPRPDIGTEQALRAAVLAARTIGYSTGPSGAGVLKLFERWGIADAVKDRVVQAPTGVPVARLIAEGKVELGFQQRSEMMDASGIALLGNIPTDCAIVSTFSAGVCAAARQPQAARQLIDFMHSPAAVAAKRRHGMDAA